jgi:hypothetical protein
MLGNRSIWIRRRLASPNNHTQRQKNPHPAHFASLAIPGGQSEPGLPSVSEAFDFELRHPIEKRRWQSEEFSGVCDSNSLVRFITIASSGWTPIKAAMPVACALALLA